jgi:DNA-binding MarR family transcriptional regulator
MHPTICACSKLRRSARIVTTLYDEALSPSGLGVAQYGLLRMIERVGPCSLSALAEATALDRTTLNRNLRPLEQAGLVVSAGCTEDHRSRIVRISDKGRATIRTAEPQWQAAEARIDALLGADRQALFRILDRVETLRS